MTYCADTDVEARAPIAVEAVATVNAARARRSLADRTLADWRADACAEINRVLLRRGITTAMVSRPDDLIPAEVALVVTLLCEAATQSPVTAGASKVDQWGQNAAYWRTVYVREIEAAAPVLGVKATGRSFGWNRA